MGKLYKIKTETGDSEKRQKEPLKLSEAEVQGNTILVPSDAQALTVTGGKVKVIKND